MIVGCALGCKFREWGDTGQIFSTDWRVVSANAGVLCRVVPRSVGGLGDFCREGPLSLAAEVFTTKRHEETRSLAAEVFTAKRHEEARSLAAEGFTTKRHEATHKKAECTPRRDALCIHSVFNKG